MIGNNVTFSSYDTPIGDFIYYVIYMYSVRVEYMFVIHSTCSICNNRMISIDRTVDSSGKDIRTINHINSKEKTTNQPINQPTSNPQNLGFNNGVWKDFAGFARIIKLPKSCPGALNNCLSKSSRVRSMCYPLARRLKDYIKGLFV